MYEGTPDRTRIAGGTSSSATRSTSSTRRRRRSAHMKWGPRARTAARSVVAAAARLRRRADQPRGVGLVPRAHRRRALPDRRHVVADRDGDDHDHPLPGHHETGLGDEAVPGRRCGRLRRAGQQVGPAGTATWCSGGVAGDAARDLQGSRPFRRHVLVEVPRAPTSPARSADRRGRRLLAARPRRRRHERIRPSHLDVEVESALVDHPKVAEAAVCGRNDAQTGQAIVAYVTGAARTPPSRCSRSCATTLRRSAIANRPTSSSRPSCRGRSGKIMRRLLRDVAENRPLGDTTTLADPPSSTRSRRARSPRPRNSQDPDHRV